MDSIVSSIKPAFVYFINASNPRYVNKDREKTKAYIQHAEKRGVTALFITVDAPQLGRREKVRTLIIRRFLLSNYDKGHAHEIR